MQQHGDCTTARLHCSVHRTRHTTLSNQTVHFRQQYNTCTQAMCEQMRHTNERRRCGLTGSHTLLFFCGLFVFERTRPDTHIQQAHTTPLRIFCTHIYTVAQSLTSAYSYRGKHTGVTVLIVRTECCCLLSHNGFRQPILKFHCVSLRMLIHSFRHCCCIYATTDIATVPS